MRRLGWFRAWFTATTVLTLVSVVVQPACARQQAGDPYTALRSGEYGRAIGGLERLAAAPDAEPRVYRALADALCETGRCADAERALRTASQRGGRLAIELANTLGETLHAQGKRAEAEESFKRAVDGNASDAVPARLNLAVLAYERGEMDAAMQQFDRFIDIYNGGETLSADDLTAVATAVGYMGIRNHQLFQDATRAYDEAIRADAASPGLPASTFEPRLLMGELFLEKYNSTEAQTLFGEVLAANPRHARALLGVARAQYFDGTPAARELVDSALAVNPNLVAGRVFRGQLLADVERYDEAIDEIERALVTDASNLAALSTLAGIHYLRADMQAYEAVRQRALAANPRFADFYNRIADLSVRQRQYGRAVTLARQAIELEPTSWRAWGILGLNQLRAYDVNYDEARASLETAFKGDPYNPWYKNTLDLMDTFEQYRNVSSDRFSFMLHASEADVLAVYMRPLAEEAYTKLAERYGFQPRTPVRVEVYPSHADFSVRTVGLSGLGALGVAFGNLLAMDSPIAQDRRAFNWGSTLWHEIAHVFTLGMTEHHVPRWLTEGLSVHEERRARPGWGDDISLEWLAAYKAKQINPVSQLNEGFVRPKFPSQVGFTYFQASIIVEMIENESGFGTIQAMLRAYGEGKNDETVFREVLKTDLASFDRQFDAYVRERWGSVLDVIRVPENVADSVVIPSMIAPQDSGPPDDDDLFGQIAAGVRAMRAEDYEAARPFFQRAKRLFPEYAGEASPYRALAEIHAQAGNMAAAAAELEQLTALDETDYASNMKLAEIHRGLGNGTGEANALERAVWISPYDMALHTRLAEVYAAADAQEAFVQAFVKAWDKVMQSDRFELD